MPERKNYDSPEYDIFKKKIKSMTGLDLNSYKNQIHRRVHMLMQRWDVTSYEIYYEIIKKDDKKLREFLDYLTINVSEFFRNLPRWQDLEMKIIPELIKTRGSKRLKLWSAGCATGEEPYSLAILSSETGLSCPPHVLASDIDEGAIKIAKNGVYQKKQTINILQERITKYFTSIDSETLEIKNDVKKRVSFERINLIEDGFKNDFDLILCRNVVIYFEAETKRKLYEKFFKALRPGGCLLVGSTEQIFEHRSIGFESAGPFIYRKPQ
ncbi:protein-glutamate O-methyltransferase CheR [Aminobacterium sp. MB27-C1]|jgi:chemotaxis protein methyltransferase CheR|uniref:CheR family methyltransferase n=1 Tax=Aminobacterium sp. MB27-C1 TaxID=3070661 RepID=UPI001BCDF1D1|nr:protein-glutamate O-methyltransferase CheR [Aminobacterium sp. MB27-C1]MDD2207430.1 protein-glutamate O-methyltransferase CheR [Aminobacterium sp.]WMI70436.1 protein-glutamate O-methyltransferase CheR [Aminobacterium sp. MB27-C1]